LVAGDEQQMERHLNAVRNDADLRRSLVENGLAAIRSRHSCAHRAEQLLAILATYGAGAPMEMSA
jgi:spore maturation protein CgeB